jgi:L-ascorbate metabolism protein UlaG (beta-lactamase superfamily)
MSPYPQSDHYDGLRFFNPWGVQIQKTAWDVLKWKLNGQAKAWPTSWKPPETRSPEPTGKDLQVTYIGHATTWIQGGGLSILTDPQFSERASPLSWLGPKRFRPPGLRLEDLTSVTTVVISHNHYDHLDLPSLQAIDQKFSPRFYVPLGNAALLRSVGIQNVRELDWWQEEGPVQLVPVQHWSARTLWDRNQALWGGYLLRVSGKKIFFAGDTGYGPHFRWIQERMGPPDLSLLPIGAYEPRDFMREQHMNPADAVQAHLDLGSKASFAIHFETFQLTDEGFEEPRTQLKIALSEQKLPESTFFIPQWGETWTHPSLSKDEPFYLKER